ncbi:MAG: hypothetical protein P1U74_07230 [Legionellaceae bacterium]|nr:hypothetical protein [Legionellaceae bacterium]
MHSKTNFVDRNLYSHNELAKFSTKSELTDKQRSSLLKRACVLRDGYYFAVGSKITFENSQRTFTLKNPILKAGGTLYEIRDNFAKGGQGELFVAFCLSTKMFCVMKRALISRNRMIVSKEVDSEREALDDHNWNIAWTKYAVPHHLSAEEDNSSEYLGYVFYSCQFMPYLGKNLRGYYEKLVTKPLIGSDAHRFMSDFGENIRDFRERFLNEQLMVADAHRWQLAADACWGVYQLQNGHNIYHKNSDDQGLGYGHRDLKPDNIIWNGKNIRIIDFGFSKKDPESSVSCDRGTNPYLLRTNKWLPISTYDLYAMQISLKNTSYQPKNSKEQKQTTGMLTNDMLMKTAIRYRLPQYSLSINSDVDNSDYMDFIDSWDADDQSNTYFPAKNMLTLTAVVIAAPIPNMSYGKLKTIGGCDVLAATIVGIYYENIPSSQKQSKIHDGITKYQQKDVFFSSPSRAYFVSDAESEYYTGINSEFTARANLVIYGLDDCVEEALKCEFLLTVLDSKRSRLIKMAAAKLYKCQSFNEENLAKLETHSEIPKLCIRACLDENKSSLEFILTSEYILPVLKHLETFELVDQFDFFLSYPNFIPYILRCQISEDVLFLRGLLEEGLDDTDDFEMLINGVKKVPLGCLRNLKQLFDDPLYSLDEIVAVIANPVAREAWRYATDMQLNSRLLHSLLTDSIGLDCLTDLRRFPLDNVILDVISRHLHSISWLYTCIRDFERLYSDEGPFFDRGAILYAFLANKDYRDVMLVAEFKEKVSDPGFEPIVLALLRSSGLRTAPVIARLLREGPGVPVSSICNENFFHALCDYIRKNHSISSDKYILRIPILMKLKHTLRQSCTDENDFNTVSKEVFHYLTTAQNTNTCLFAVGNEKAKCRLINLLHQKNSSLLIFECFDSEYSKRQALRKHFLDDTFIRAAILLDSLNLCSLENLGVLSKNNAFKNALSSIFRPAQNLFISSDDIELRLLCASFDLSIDYRRPIDIHMRSLMLQTKKFVDKANLKIFFKGYVKLNQALQNLENEFNKDPSSNTIRVSFRTSVEALHQKFYCIYFHRNAVQFSANLDKYLDEILKLVTSEQVSKSIDKVESSNLSEHGCCVFFRAGEVSSPQSDILSSINSIKENLGLTIKTVSKPSSRIYPIG